MNTLSRSVTATADATGKATFTFPPVTQGQWWQASVTVPKAPSSATFTLSLDHTERFGWLGSQPGAVVTAPSMASITVTATGLTHTVTYQAILAGGWTVGRIQGQPPQGPSSFALTKITGTITAKLTGPITVETAATKPLDISGPVTISGVPKVAFTGNQPVTIEAGSATVTTKITEVITGVDFSVINKATTVLSIGNESDALGTFILTTTVGVNTLIIPATKIKKPYSFLLIITGEAGTPPVATSVDVTAAWILTPVRFSSTFSQAPGTGLGSGIYSFNCMLPIATKINTSINVKLWCNSAKRNSHFYVHGLTSNPGVQLRSDGRTYPLGALTFTFISTGSSSKAVVPAPSSPLRILLSSINVSLAATGNPYVRAGHRLLTGINSVAYQGSLSLPPGGLLLPAGSGITYGATAAVPVSVSGTYDLVV